LARRSSARLLAARETEELRAEERHLARALGKALLELGVDRARDWHEQPGATHAALFAEAAADADVAPVTMAQAYTWAWCENQVLAALKLMSLGQSAGLRVLRTLQARIPRAVDRAIACDDDAIGTSAPRAAMASAWHETQYSRLFRS
ncbi:urease accessory protein UreF, partial [bacterium]